MANAKKIENDMKGKMENRLKGNENYIVQKNKEINCKMENLGTGENVKRIKNMEKPFTLGAKLLSCILYILSDVEAVV